MHETILVPAPGARSTPCRLKAVPTNLHDQSHTSRIAERLVRPDSGNRLVARNEPLAATIGPVVGVELERIEALELLGMTLAHLKDAEARAEMSPRVALLLAIRDKLALGLREER